MEDNVSSELKSKDDELESKKAQEVIGLLLSKSDENSDEVLQQVDFTIEKVVHDVPSSAVTVSIEGSSPLSVCHGSLTDAGMLLESGDIIQQSLGSSTSIKLEDGTLIQSFEPVEGTDTGESAKFIDGQIVQLEDGTTAFIHAVPREGLQPVQLEDGTMAYLSQSNEELFNGEASTLDLENLSVTQVSDGEGKEYVDIKVGDSINLSCGKGTSCRGLEKAFRCPYEDCRRLYTTYHHLKVHERSHTGDRPFKCPMNNCGKAFATGYGLKSHIRVHTGETPYKCAEDSCQKAFKTSGDLQKHLRTHTGERPFKCPYSGCDRAFTTSNIRKVHIRTHTGERPYVCKEDGCGRAFASATNYKNHIRIHTGEKPYACSVVGCNKRFTEYSSLYKHHVVHTHSKPYICSVCGKTYRQASTLAMHKRTSHGIVDSVDNEATSNPEGKAIEPDQTDMELDEPVKEKSTSTKQKNEPKNNSKNSVVNLSEAVTTVSTSSTSTVVTVQGATTQLLQQHPVYALQVQEDGTLTTTTMQQIVVVTDPEQVAALQRLAQQGQLGSVLAIADQNSTSEKS